MQEKNQGLMHSSKRSVDLLFPHQLFAELPWGRSERVYLVEEHLFFRQYNFNVQKLVFHRASMKAFEASLVAEGVEVEYIDSSDEACDIRTLVGRLAGLGVTHIRYIDPEDDWLHRRLKKVSTENSITLEIFDSPLFINRPEELTPFFKPDKKKYFQTAFYKEQRKQRGILMDEDGKPAGGQWTYDKDNRKRYPKKKTPPPIHWPETNHYFEEAKSFVSAHYPNALGSIDDPLYPVTRSEAQRWLDRFLIDRFAEFGPYEDAIVHQELVLHHSLLSPLMNVGLLTPKEVLEQALDYASHNAVPIESLEGFVRQIMGWREFIRGMYRTRGRDQRTRNYWSIEYAPLPAELYTGETGVAPVDAIIKKVLKTGYCHHIERLMVLGNYMALKRYHPDAVYQWFMELFIDAYDWVMVPNVYAMSLYADGGLMTTKPYISGSNYIKKMGDFAKGDWEAEWDKLFWGFLEDHRDFFMANPRMRMLLNRRK